MQRLPHQTIKSADGQYEIRTVHRGLPINARLEITLWQINEQKRWINTGKKATVPLRKAVRTDKELGHFRRSTIAFEPDHGHVDEIQNKMIVTVLQFKEQLAEAVRSIAPRGEFEELLEKLG